MGASTKPTAVPSISPMGLTLKNVLINAAYYAITVVILPWVILAGEGALGVARAPAPGLRLAGAGAIAAGGGLQAWCIVIFQRHGGGTPLPAVPTRRLVTRGPYRLVRNPMNLGEVLLFLGLAGWFGSPGLVAYALAALLAFHLFIVRVEEPRHAREFADEFREYCAATGRWFPRPRRHRQNSQISSPPP